MSEENLPTDEQKNSSEELASQPDNLKEKSMGLTPKFDELLKKVAEITSKTEEELKNALKEILGEPTDESVEDLKNNELVTDEDLLDSFKSLNLPKVQARKAINVLRGPKVEAQAQEVQSNAGSSMSLLPSDVDDTSFIELLKTGGELKVKQANVLSAIRASIASRVGLFKLKKKLIQAMEDWAESQDEPCGDAFYELQRLITKSDYAFIFDAINAKGFSATDAKKNKLLDRLDDYLWPELISFHELLKQWVDNWSKGAANPAMAFQMLAMSQSGNKRVMPPGMMEPPPTDHLLDAAEEVINKINKVFAGTGAPVARALAWDAKKIKEVLENPALPATIGAANKDQMIKSLGIAVGADYVRLERNIAKYALAVMELPKVSSDEELSYLGAMFTLGGAIGWDKLQTPSFQNKSGRQSFN